MDIPAPDAPDAGAFDVTSLTDRPLDEALACPFDAGVADVPVGPGASVGSVSCASAPRFTASTTLSGERPPVGPRLAVRVPGCLPYGAFQALYYEVVVGPGRSLRATVRPTAASVQVQILSGCNALGCRAISPERALWTNPGSAPASALVLVAFTARPTLASSVDVALELLGSPVEACAGALRLTPGVPSPEQVVAPTAAAALCPNDPGGSPSAGAMQPFRVTIPPGEMLTAVARSLTPGLAVATAVTATCGAQSCLGYMRAAPAAEQTLIFENTGSRALEVVLGVAGSPASAAGRFVVTATTAAPAGGTCAGAPAFEAAGWYPGRTATNPAAVSLVCDGSFRPVDRVHRRVRVAAGGILAGDSSWMTDDPAAIPSAWIPVSVSTGCDPGECALASPRNVIWTNDSASPVDAVIDLSYPAGYQHGEISRFRTISPSAGSPSTCAAPARVALPLSQDVSFGGIAPQLLPCSDDEVAGALFYRVTVPARHTLFASGLSAYHSTPRLRFRVVDRCDTGRCTDGGTPFADYPSEGRLPSGLAWFNPSFSPRDVTVEVSAPVGGSFTLSTQASIAINQCEQAAPLTAGVAVAVPLNGGHAEQRLPCCAGPASGPATTFDANYYSITVPARRTLRAYLPAVAAPHRLQILSSCAERAVLACGGSPTSIIDVARWRNDSDAPRTVLVVVGKSADLSRPIDVSGFYELSLVASFEP